MVAQRRGALGCALAVANSRRHFAAHPGPRLRRAVARMAAVGRPREEAAAGVARPRRPATVAGAYLRVCACDQEGAHM